MPVRVLFAFDVPRSAGLLTVPSAAMYDRRRQVEAVRAEVVEPLAYGGVEFAVEQGQACAAG